MQLCIMHRIRFKYPVQSLTRCCSNCRRKKRQASSQSQCGRGESNWQLNAQGRRRGEPVLIATHLYPRQCSGERTRFKYPDQSLTKCCSNRKRKKGKVCSRLHTDAGSRTPSPPVMKHLCQIREVCPVHHVRFLPPSYKLEK
jgi:hypothetical protein